MKHKHSKSVCTMSPDRLVKILAYLREYAQQLSKAYEKIAEQVCHAFAATSLKMKGIIGKMSFSKDTA